MSNNHQPMRDLYPQGEPPKDRIGIVLLWVLILCMLGALIDLMFI